MKDQFKGYSIILTRDDGSELFALSTSGKAFFYTYSAAKKFRDELTLHLKKIGRIVKVKVTIEEY